jgi:hypothetical protein
VHICQWNHRSIFSMSCYQVGKTLTPSFYEYVIFRSSRHPELELGSQSVSDRGSQLSSLLLCADNQLTPRVDPFIVTFRAQIE